MPWSLRGTVNALSSPLGSGAVAGGKAGDPADTAAVSVHTFELKGAEDLREAASGADLRVVQLAPGVFHGTMMHAQVGDLALGAGDFGPGIRVRGVMNPESVTLGMLLETTGAVSQWDFDVVPGDVVVFPRSAEQEGRFSGHSSFATVTLGARQIAAYAAGEGRLREPEFWMAKRRYRAPSFLRQSACRRIVRCMAQLRRGDVASSGGGIDLFRRSLLEAFLAGIIHASADEERRYPGARLVRDVEDHVDTAGLERSVHVSELCAALAVSRRTLHRAFHDTLGVGPVAYLRLRRLSAVHGVLRVADPPYTSVTQAALEHGFAELGRFAGYYYHVFRENPSETRRKAMAGLRPPAYPARPAVAPSLRRISAAGLQ